MSLSYSSKITTRGLTFAADAANPASLDSSKITKNLLAYSDFSASSWTKVNATAISGITDPNGGVTAVRIKEDLTNGSHNVALATLIPLIVGSVYCFSFYAKAAEITVVQFQCNNATFGTNGITEFNLGTGAIGAFNQTATAAITSAGNGWYRCSVYLTAVTTGSSPEFSILGSVGSTNAYQGDGTKGFSLWGPQLEYGTVPTNYSPNTTSTITPRWYDLTGTSRPITTGLNSVEVLVVAGGGAGGSGNGMGYEAGGGGGGGLIYNAAYPVSSGTYNVTVGTGGTGVPPGGSPASNLCTNGGNSIFGPLIAIGGGAGGSGGFNGNTGGSGGGAAYLGTTSRLLGGGSVASQGNNGGAHMSTTLGDATNRGGGGGGAGGGGVPANGGGAGGPGLPYSISGTLTYYAGGGGCNAAGTGGLGGGGSGGSIPTAGAANYGGGGGGGGWDGSSAAPIGQGANGGSGVIIVRYPEPQRASGGTITIANGYVTHTFTAGTSSFVIAPTPTENRTYGSFVNNVQYDNRNSGSLVFDNNTSYVAFPELPSQTNAPLSVFAWVYLNTTPTGTNGIWGHYGSTNNVHFECYSTYTRIRLGSIDNTTLPIMTAGSWQFVGFTSTGSSHSYYVNGVLSTTWTGNTGTVLGSSGAFPSSHMIGRSDAGRVWNGRIAHVAVYNAELTAAEVLNNFNALRGRYGV